MKIIGGSFALLQSADLDDADCGRITDSYRTTATWRPKPRTAANAIATGNVVCVADRPVCPTDG